MTLEQIQRLQRPRQAAPTPHVVVWSGVLDRQGATFSLHGTEGWNHSQMHNILAISGEGARQHGGVVRR